MSTRSVEVVLPRRVTGFVPAAAVLMLAGAVAPQARCGGCGMWCWPTTDYAREVERGGTDVRVICAECFAGEMAAAA